MATTENTPGLEEKEGLQRGLSNRHIQLIAIGGAIGTGLFMGSGKTISLAGPSLLLVYAIIGVVIFLVLRAMGELLLSNLSYKTFNDFITDILGPSAGFLMGWSYWFTWVVIGVADIIAITGYVHFWWPDLPAWIPAVCLIGLLLTLNLPSVKNFGEIEFWFALIKIVAIVLLIIVGAIMVIAGFTSPSGQRASVENLWNDGGFFPMGASGFFAAFQIGIFAFLGAELIGTTAAETKNPTVTLPRAINAVPLRIIVFYVLTLAVILMVTPWRTIDPEQSPFVEMFTLAGLAIAAHLINFVVLTSATSSANSGIFSTSRLIFGLAQTGSAPAIFGRLSKNGVPRNGLFLTTVLLFSGIILLYSGDSLIEAFTLVTTVASVLTVVTWSLIMVSYIKYRKTRPELHESSVYKLPGGIYTCYLVLAFFVGVIVLLFSYEDTRQALIAMPFWYALLALGWFFIHRNNQGTTLKARARQKALEHQEHDSSAQ
ncbi:amino acid permease [Rothia sp. CCM 9417]|uniref:amino acid permease n=1 Tax=unclassified Rothia (in: high G+C Gram-positive bacteria) TaxID=2689056 RepID=UPI003AE82D46